MVLGHLALAGVLLNKYDKVEEEDGDTIKVFYKGVWELFYAEYVLYTMI